MFSKMSKESQRLYLQDKYKINLNSIKNKKIQLNLSDEEIINRDYYKGRFVSINKSLNRTIYNWEEVSLNEF